MPKLTFRHVVILLAALALGALRIGGVKTDLFKTTAHLFVMFLFGEWWGTRRYGKPDRFCFWTAAALSIVETVCFLVSRFLLPHSS